MKEEEEGEEEEEEEEEGEEEEEEQEEKEKGTDWHWGRSSGNCGRIIIRGGRRRRGARSAQRKEAAHRCSKLAAAGANQINNNTAFNPRSCLVGLIQSP
jgi:hypothetical protein